MARRRHCIEGADLSTNPGPDDARRPGRSFSDAAALFQPIIPVAGTPVVTPPPTGLLPGQDLPPATEPQPIPDAPRVPPVVARAEPVVFRPAPVTLERPVVPVPDTPAEPAVVEPLPQAAAPQPRPQARRRWWPVLAIPAVLAAIAGLALLQPTAWTWFGDASPATAGGTTASTPVAPAASPPAAPARDAAATDRPVPPAPLPSAPAAPPNPEPAVAAPIPAEPPPTTEATPQPTPAAPDAVAEQRPVFPVVAIRIRAGSAAGQAEASRIATLLTESAGRIDVQAVPTGLQAPTIRYFRPDDAAGARALAAALPRTGPPWRVMGMRTPRNAVPGRFEVWIPVL